MKHLYIHFLPKYFYNFVSASLIPSRALKKTNKQFFLAKKIMKETQRHDTTSWYPSKYLIECTVNKSMVGRFNPYNVTMSLKSGLYTILTYAFYI